jgi:Uma2 family endonuclease
VEKLEMYFDAGVKSGWLVQPTLRSIAVFTPDMASTVYTSGELTDPALGITINLNEIFG